MKLLTRSLRLNLVFGFALSCLVGLLVFGILAHNVAIDSYHKTVHQNLVNTYADNAQRFYQEHGTWEGMDPGPPPAREGQPGAGGPPPGPQGAGRPREDLQRGMRPDKRLGVFDPQGNVVSKTEKYQRGQQVNPEDFLFTREIVVNGQVVGTAFEEPGAGVNSPDQQAMVNAINLTILMAGAIGLALAILLGAAMAGQLTRPLERLTLAVRSLRYGKAQEPVQEQGTDEVAVLTRAFNQMSDQLVKAEQQRRQMIADIAHDLGTPLTVASGYVQSMQQGKLGATKERLEVVYDELLLLQNLVDDLRLLSLADAGMLTLSRDATAPEVLLRSIQKAFSFRAEKQKIKLTLQVDENLPEVSLDVERMRQVLGNLVNNALHYTPEGGEIRLIARKVEGGVMLQVQDTGVGIPAEKLPFIFERFYRVDETRSPENGGGSGLGLAIARSIVELHGGKISAHSVLRQGTTISILAPV
ncbi:sensor histidine kinase [Deinococcus cellulosilyticus]|uniref:histidine kinase n=1 Tax=Deinococcus cellulosilyticus (strain DSM 18568 / NBRC 106333 / KACC 11606 / 5516J-15) TaxID=1223518 RepID=A0A511N6I9_DEIC1|nr:HAMP domain-containing sensor histidine kinase [Deinococcus cellulosilyticus]GEM48489.1 two-component sensor histidine kinase [Deinococcus cellulosilyticus NBRC 106333 = KACC 11606]